MLTYRRVALLAALVAPLALGAQPMGMNMGTAKPHSGAGFFLGGVGNASLSDLNGALRGAGYDEFGRGFWSFGGGGYGLRGRTLIGGEGHGAIWSAVSSGGRETNLSGGYGLFDLGFVLRQTQRSIVYGMVAIGGAALEMRIDDRAGVGLGPDRRDPTFAEVLADPGHRSRLSRGGPMFGLGIGADRFASARGGLLIGVRAGVRFSTMADRWRMYDEQVFGGPTASFNGPYVEIAIGGGRRR